MIRFDALIWAAGVDVECERMREGKFHVYEALD